MRIPWWSSFFVSLCVGRRWDLAKILKALTPSSFLTHNIRVRAIGT